MFRGLLATAVRVEAMTRDTGAMTRDIGAMTWEIDAMTRDI